jgi:hypothetical protein
LRRSLLHLLFLIAALLIDGDAVLSQELPKSPKPIEVSNSAKLSTKKFLILSGAVYTAATMDMHRTMAWRDAFAKQGAPFHSRYEADPLARPFIQLPKPAYYATGLALATGINYVGWRMARSRHLHKVWFLPQLLTIGGNSYGYTTTWHK